MRVAIALFCMILASCGPLPPLDPPPTPDPPSPVENADCGAVCERAAELGCEWAKPTPEGTPCEEVCQNIQQSGIVQWDLGCRAGARSCEEADACER